MHLDNILAPDRCVLDLDTPSKKRTLEAMSGLLAQASESIASRVVFDALCARERLGSTGLGAGVAIPHGRIPGLEFAVGAFARLASPVDFDTPDGKPVDLVFALIVPEECTDTHLEILAAIAGVFSADSIRDTLRAEPDAAVVCALLGRAPVEA